MSRVVPSLDTQEFYAGDTQVLVVTLTDANGDPVDVSAGDFTCEIRDERLELATPIVTVICNVSVSYQTDGTDGVVILTLTASESIKMRPYRRLYWDLEYTEGSNVATLFQGQISVTRDITN